MNSARLITKLSIAVGVIITLSVALAVSVGQAREKNVLRDFPAKDIGLKNHGTLASLQPGARLVALSDDITDLAYLRDYDGDRVDELIFHTRRREIHSSSSMSALSCRPRTLKTPKVLPMPLRSNCRHMKGAKYL